MTIKPGDTFYVKIDDKHINSSGVVTIICESAHSMSGWNRWEVRHNIIDSSIGTHWTKSLFENEDPKWKFRKINHYNTKLGKILYK